MVEETSTAAQLGTTSLSQETVIESLPVEGRLPPWLTGTLIRNGPARFEAGDRSVRHFLDGMAMLPRFTVADGRFLREPLPACRSAQGSACPTAAPHPVRRSLPVLRQMPAAGGAPAGTAR